MKAVVFTLGCKVNSCESNSIISGLENLGYEVSTDLSYADLYVINTCAVTKEAERKSRQAVARVRKFNDKAKIIVVGCASQNHPNDFLSKDGVTVVCGTNNKCKILNLLDKKGVFIDSTDCYVEEFIPSSTKTRAFVKVQDGCNNFCSYCIIPYLRGRCRSRSITSIKREIESLNALEVVLTAINLTAYDYEGQKLSNLIEALSDVSKRIRLGSLEENKITNELLSALKILKDFAPHFHMSLQSGCSKILKDMNRKYTTFEFLACVDKIRQHFPSAAITTDVIVGYPTETEEDFNESIEFIKSVGFADIHAFMFSKREGTIAGKLKDLPYSIKKARLDKLIELKTQLKFEFISKNLEKTFEVITEEYESGYTTGYTENYIKVYIPKNLKNGKYKIKLIKPMKDGALAQLV